MSRIGSLPLSNLGCGFVFLSSRKRTPAEAEPALENVLFFRNRAHISAAASAVGLLLQRVAALAAHMDQICKRLGAGSPLMKISALPAESISSRRRSAI